jgi:AraC-like DNA-binding protein
MRNRFFTPDMLAILLSPEEWRVYGPHCPPPVPPVRDPAHEEWMREHSHRHKHIEVMFVLSGYGKHGYRGQVYPFRPGTVFCFGPDEPHDVQVPEWAEDTDLLWVNLTAKGFTARLIAFRQDLPRAGGNLGHLLMIEDAGVLGPNPLLYQRFIEGSREAVRPLQVRAGLELLVATIVEHGYEKPWVPEEPVARQAIRMVEHYIHEVGGATTLDDCARLAGYSKSHFQRLFQLFARSRVQDYIDDCRVIRTAEFKEAGWKQYQIAAYFGQSPQSFSRWYKRLRRQRPF